MDRHLAPIDQPVFLLDCKKAFENLTDKEKKYAHYMSQASWYGSLICLDQTSVEAPVIFNILQKLFHGDSITSLQEKAAGNGVLKEDFTNLLQYAATFYGNLGNYQSFGDTKFVPRIPADKFRSVLEGSAAKDELLKLFDGYKDRIYSLDSNVLSLALPPKGVSTYYSDNITEKDIELVKDFMQERGISPYNTRLWKLAENSYEIKIAAAHKKEESTDYKGAKIKISYGDHSTHLAKLVENMKAALPFAASPVQTEMLQHYIRHFEEGPIDHHKNAQRQWIKDIGPVVETNIGFIESYRDPAGARGEFEGFVAVVNKEMSAKFAKLVSGATQFIPQLPWPKEFEKDKFLKPDFTSLEVVTFASSGIPSGINIPNYDDIRQTEGFKNVSLANVIAAKSKDPIEFIEEKEHQLYNELDIPAFEVQVGIHELLGHGTGKLFHETAEGTFNFPTDLKNPLTGGKITSWYKPGETWDTKFSSFASTMEECRAECTGLYLCTDPALLEIFGHKGQEAEDIFYINWLIMVRAGIRALEFYTPEHKKWGQAHMQARFVILRVLMNAGEGLVQIKRTADNVIVSLDNSKITTVGKKAIGDFLTKLQVYKSTADVENGTKMYGELSQVDDEFLAIREIVLSKKKPRRVFVQAHTYLENDSVKLKEFDATVEGIIQSFVTRF